MDVPVAKKFPSKPGIALRGLNPFPDRVAAVFRLPIAAQHPGAQSTQNSRGIISLELLVRYRKRLFPRFCVHLFAISFRMEAKP